MNPETQSSFIPKKPLTTVGLHSSSSAFGSLLFLIALLLFLASVVSGGAVFAYSKYLTGTITSKVDSLNKGQAAFDPSTIQDLIRMDSRLNNAQVLLQKHVAPSVLFSFIAAQTLQRVSFGSFSYVLGDNGSVSINLSGEADGAGVF